MPVLATYFFVTSTMSYSVSGVEGVPNLAFTA